MNEKDEKKENVCESFEGKCEESKKVNLVDQRLDVIIEDDDGYID